MINNVFLIVMVLCHLCLILLGSGVPVVLGGFNKWAKGVWKKLKFKGYLNLREKGRGGGGAKDILSRGDLEFKEAARTCKGIMYISSKSHRNLCTFALFFYL